MNDFDYSKPYSVEYSGSGSKEESKERFEGLLAKWDEIFQRDKFITRGEMKEERKTLSDGSKGLPTLVWNDDSESLSAFYGLESRGILEGGTGWFDKWTFSYATESGKILGFEFWSHNESARLSLKLKQSEEIKSRGIVPIALLAAGAKNTKTLYEASCYVKYAENAAEYFDALGGISSRDEEYQKMDKRGHFFTAIGKEDVFDHGKKLFDLLQERIANEKQKASDTQKAADKKAFEDALGDL